MEIWTIFKELRKRKRSSIQFGFKQFDISKKRKQNWIGFKVLIAAVALGLAIPGAYAFLNDTETSTNNVFQAASVFPTATPSASPTPTPPQIAQTLVMNELLPLSSCSSGQTNGQFLELWNGSGSTVNLQNFQLSDGTNTIAIANSNTNLSNNAFAVLVKSAGVIQQCLDNISGSAVTVNLGGQLDLNTGTLQLLDSGSTVIDTIEWGSGQDLQPTIDQSIERQPLGLDTALGTSFNSSDMVIRTTDTPGFQGP